MVSQHKESLSLLSDKYAQLENVPREEGRIFSERGSSGTREREDRVVIWKQGRATAEDWTSCGIPQGEDHRQGRLV
jgi:hypothetical protein